jgi:hypothetical protein
MSEKTLFKVIIGGRDVSNAMAPIVESISVHDGTDNEADTASLTLSDEGGLTVMSRKRDPVAVSLGRTGEGMGLVFQGFVDEVRSKGNRSKGRTLSIECKSVDLGGNAKETKEKHWEDKNLQQILDDAFSATGISVKVSPELASIVREYEAMDSEDPLTFAARLAKEVGGTFKMMGPQAVLVKRNSGSGIDGSALQTFDVKWGVNLIDWDISPIISRAEFGSFNNRWFDFAKNKFVEETEKGTGAAKHRRSNVEPGQSLAKQRATADKIDADRKGGEGTVVTKGSFLAQAEGRCKLQGIREAVDGVYVISAVDHEASRDQGYECTLEVKQPQDGAGKDSR